MFMCGENSLSAKQRASPISFQKRPGICLRLYRYHHDDPDKVIAFAMVCRCA
jgi:hypothetical protein